MNEQEQNKTNQNNEQEEALTRQNIEAQIITKVWKDEAYKKELLANPKVVVGQAFGVEFAEEVTVKVLEENPTSLYFVLPMSPMQIVSELSEEELEEIAGGSSGYHRKLRTGQLAGSIGWNFGIGMVTVPIAGQVL